VLREEKREMRSLNGDFVKNAFVSAHFFLWDKGGGGRWQGKLDRDRGRVENYSISWLEGERHMCNLELERQIYTV
jgi:hypothetical protein